MSSMKYKRILLKLSGEAFGGNMGKGIDFEIVDSLASRISELVKLDVEVGVVVGGGNFWRGREGKGMDRTVSDHMGMLGTVLNALALQDSLEKLGIYTRVQTAIEMTKIAEPYIRRRAVRHLEKHRVVIFACGTGNPFFSTDTGAALRAAEINAEVILLAKTVDGVYDDDPKKNSNAKKLDKLTYMDVLNNGLGVMDATATSLCMDNHIPIIVFGISDPENIIRAVEGQDVATIIS